MNRFCLGIIVLVAAGWSFPQTLTAQPIDGIRIGTGGSSGVYFVAGNAICRMLRIAQRDLGPARTRCAAPPSGGSIDNLAKLRDRKTDFAIVQSDWQFHSYGGTSRFKGKPNPELRSIFSLHVEPFQIVARAGSGIESWNDLAGKRVNIGNKGSGHRATFAELLTAHKQDMTRFGAVSELSSSDQSLALCEGKLDAFAFTVGVPNASIAQATDGCDGRIINLDTPEISKLIKDAPYYRWAKIPSETYATTGQEVKTIGVVATLVTRADVPKATVYQLTKALFSNFDRFRRLHPAFAQLEKTDMVNTGLSAPLHEGAAAYFREMKLLAKK